MTDAAGLRRELRLAAPDLTQRVDKLAEAWLARLKARLATANAPAFRPKLVNDPVWGTIELLPWEVALVDTPLLQRMRGVQQLGLAQLVFPGACHDRLEHIIGVIGAVEVMVRALDRQIERRNRDKDNRPSPLPAITDDDRHALRLAALFHDLGHGPFSHALEPVLEPEAVLRKEPPNQTGDETPDWRTDLKTLLTTLKSVYQFNSPPAQSEIIAAMLVLSEPLSEILNDRAFPLPSGADSTVADLQIRIVAAIVGAVEGPGADHLSAIISGQIDADKLDYLQRDAHHSGLEIGFDTDRLLARLEILQVRPDNIDASVGSIRERVQKADNQTLLQLGIAASGFGSFEQMLIGRTFLYDRLYHHHKVRAAEAMAQRLILVAERDRPKRFEFEDIFLDMGDEVILRLFAGDVTHPTFSDISPPAAALARRILDRNLLHRAFALRGRFIGVAPDLPSEKADEQRQLLWGRVVADLKDLRRRYELGEEIHSVAVRCCECLAAAKVSKLDLTTIRARLVECGAEQIIVDLPVLKADAIRILARYPNGALRIPEFSFNPVKWSNAYELQKRTTYVFSPREVLPMVALASKIVFFGRYGITMASEADGFIKAGGAIPPDWIDALVAGGLIDKKAREYLTEKRRSLVTIHASDLKAPAAWLAVDEDFGVRLAQELNSKLSGGVPKDHLDALGEVLEAMWRLVDEWHNTGIVTQKLVDERDLQQRVRTMLGMAKIKVEEGLEVSGGETDLLLNDLILLENKISGPTYSPQAVSAGAAMQGRRYAIALGSRVVLVLVAYQLPLGGIVPNKAQSVAVHQITSSDGAQVEIRITLPFGAPSPSKEPADRSVRPTATRKKPS